MRVTIHLHPIEGYWYALTARGTCIASHMSEDSLRQWCERYDIIIDEED